MILKEDFQVHETLNPKIWDGMQLKPEVRKKIVEIVAHFEEYIEVPIAIVDIQLVGSNASYNYTETSDLDVHVIANCEVVTDAPELLQVVYNMKKTSFNKDMDVTIYGVDVELYVQDIKTNIVSNGIYSVCDNQWIKEPKPIKSATKHNTEKEMSKWREKISEVVNDGSYEDVLNTINALYLMRTNSIATDGEYGKGNQLFKEIRGEGMLTALKNALNTKMSKQLSLESLRLGQLVNCNLD